MSRTSTVSSKKASGAGSRPHDGLWESEALAAPRRLLLDANIVVAALSERTRTPITSALWNKRGLPVMLATCAVASVLYVVAYPLFTR